MQIYDLYGPTETTVDVTALDCSGASRQVGGIKTIGQLMNNVASDWKHLHEVAYYLLQHGFVPTEIRNPHYNVILLSMSTQEHLVCCQHCLVQRSIVLLG